VTVAKFNRTLKPAFVAALQAQPWWGAIAGDPDLFIAVRDGYINVYYRGCSLALIRYSGSSPEVQVHYKYLVPPELKSPYITLSSPASESMTQFTEKLTRDLGKINQIKRASRPYAGMEKTGVHKIIRENSNVIDVEIALSLDVTGADPDGSACEEVSFSEVGGATARIKEKRGSAPRIDLAAFCKNKAGKVELVLFEAKLYSDPRIKAKGTAKPMVVKEQIPKYTELLQTYKSDLRQSYRRAAKLLIELRGEKAFAPVVAEVADGTPFTINTEPRLIVFGFDKDQRDNKWGAHLAKLKKLLPGRVLAAGNPGSIQLVL